MKTLLVCVFLTFCYLGIFCIWGKTFLKLIRARADVSECVLFGFIIAHVLYTMLYIPFFLTRGSYRRLSIIWVFIAAGITTCCLIFNARTRVRQKRARVSLPNALFVLLAVAVVVWLCLLVGLHPRYYHDDGYYIYDMDRMVFQDVIFQNDGILDYHRGFNSFFALFSTSCVFIGVRPFYIALFTLRFLGVILTSAVAYRTGKAWFDRESDGVSAYGMALATIVPLAMMFWSSIYTAQFFWMRTNEAKAFCLLVLLPLAFSVSTELFFPGMDRGVAWKKQLAIGLAAIPVSVSSMSPYPLLIVISAAALLVRDRFRNAGTTFKNALFCVLPNIIYAMVYLLH